MKLRNLLMTLPVLGLATPVLAQGTMIDANGDGMYSYPEIQVGNA